MPLTSYEVRWFYAAGSREDAAIRRWFESMQPMPRDADLAVPEWQGRIDGKPDVYLLLPGHADMGIKWREGQLQLKGLVADLGTQVYCGRHQGRAQRWIKWSYSGMPAAYRELFANNASGELQRIAVHKKRAMRKLRLNAYTGDAQEVSPATVVERGIGIEIAQVEVTSGSWLSLGFEAFPDDSGMSSAFTSAAGTCLSSLTELDLDADRSLSYPAWLSSL